MKKLFKYNKRTGTLIRRATGKPAGRKQVSIDGVRILTTHVIWAVVKGRLPRDGTTVVLLDKEQGLRWSNLRLVSVAALRVQARPRANNTSGVVGVSYDQRRGRWRAECCGRSLGYYANKRAAIVARRAAVAALMPAEIGIKT